MSAPIIPNAPELLSPEQRKHLARQKRERQLVRGLIRALKPHGWHVRHVNDGGDECEPVTNETEALAAVFAVDTSTLVFRHVDSHKRCGVLLVCGEGDDIIADHSAPEPDPHGFAAAIDAFMREAGLY